MGTLDEYVAGGGLPGAAARELCRQLTDSKGNHPFALVAAYMRENDPPTEATLARVLAVLDAIFPTLEGRADFDAVAAEQPPHLLALVLLLLGMPQGEDAADPLERLPALMAANRRAQLLTEHVAERYRAGDDPKAGEYPRLIEQFALMAVGEKEAKSKAGKAKGKARRERVLKLWKRFTGPKNNAGAFAKWAFVQLGGEYDANAQKTTPDVPSEKTIRLIINDHLKGR